MGEIIGCVGANPKSIIKSEFQRMEYRQGKDPAGVLLAVGPVPQVFARTPGKSPEIFKAIPPMASAAVGIGHVRHPTHGPATERNCHPISDSRRNVWVAHSGVVENCATLHSRLCESGYSFSTDTDTEIIAALMAGLLADGVPFLECFGHMMQSIEGYNAIVAYSRCDQGMLLAGKKGVALGVIERGDATLVTTCNRELKGIPVKWLADNEIALVRAGFYRTISLY